MQLTVTNVEERNALLEWSVNQRHVGPLVPFEHHMLEQWWHHWQRLPSMKGNHSNAIKAQMELGRKVLTTKTYFWFGWLSFDIIPPRHQLLFTTKSQ